MQQHETAQSQWQSDNRRQMIQYDSDNHIGSSMKPPFLTQQNKLFLSYRRTLCTRSANIYVQIDGIDKCEEICWL